MFVRDNTPFDVIHDSVERWSNVFDLKKKDFGEISALNDDFERIVNRLVTKGYKKRQAEEFVRRGLRAQESADRAMLERIIAENDLTAIHFLMKGLAISHAVGRIVIRGTTGAVIGYGTGFRVSPRLVLTNNHVISTRGTAAVSTIEFDYMSDGTDGLPKPYVVYFEPGSYFRTNKQLDFTLLALQESQANLMTANGRPWIRLLRSSGKALQGENVNIIQHPRGAPLSVAIRGNKIIKPKDEFILYTTDTEPGSSGSPVLNDQWDLVALHHSSVARQDAHGRYLKTDGNPYVNGRDRDEDIDWIANEGVRISAICDYLDQNPSPTAAEQKLYAECFTDLDWTSLIARATGGARHAVSIQGRDATSETTPARESGTPPSGPIVTPDGRVSWFFEVSMAPVCAPSPTWRERPPEPPPLTSGSNAVGVPTVTTVSSNEYYIDEITKFARPKGESYWTDAIDAPSIKAYYQNIDWNSKPENLSKQLSRHLNDTHKEKLDYVEARFKLYGWADLWPEENGERTNRLRCLYSGATMDTTAIIQEEMETLLSAAPDLAEALDQGRLDRFFTMANHDDERFEESFRESSMAGQGGNDLSATLKSPFNCEHVVPQSWFNKRKLMKCDMHHLFTCEKGCNSYRNNYPYAELNYVGTVNRAEAAERYNCGKRDTNDQGVESFEPQWQEAKGPAARATLYFLLRYPGEVGGPKELNKDDLDMLLKWHKDYPPKIWERHRNRAISIYQGNRNPLIDFDSFEWSAAHFSRCFARP